MASHSKLRNTCDEDRISRLPDEILCHILSLFSTKEAVKTSALSRRWKNVWTSVPSLDLDVDEFGSEDDIPDPDRFANFVERVLLFRGSSSIRRFRLKSDGINDVSRIDAWILTAIRRNVVELELANWSYCETFELPRSLFMCNTLVVLKLSLTRDVIISTPSSNCFSCLKFLDVRVLLPDCDSLQRLFSSCPALEDLIVAGFVSFSSPLNLNIFAPKLKRLQMNVNCYTVEVDEECKHFVNIDAPNLEKFDVRDDFAVSYSLKNANSLSKAKIDFPCEGYNRFFEAVNILCRLFAGVCSTKYLSISAPILGDLGSQHQCLLPVFNNLNNLELRLQTCRRWTSLIPLLKISPNLKHVVLESNCQENHEGFVHDWFPPEFVPVCLSLHIKTICIRMRKLQSCPNQIKVINYLVKHGKILNKVTIFARYFPISLRSKFSAFPRGSKTCEIELRNIT